MSVIEGTARRVAAAPPPRRPALFVLDAAADYLLLIKQRLLNIFN